MNSGPWKKNWPLFSSDSNLSLACLSLNTFYLTRVNKLGSMGISPPAFQFRTGAVMLK